MSTQTSEFKRDARETAGCIQTFTGRAYWPLSPWPEDVDIEDIAHALSMVCRFNGHCREFYSVAQHSVLVSQNVPARLALAGLLHDAAEAYLGDIVKPLKGKTRIGALTFSGHETMNLHAISTAIIGPDHDFHEFLSDEVRTADLRALATEKRDLMRATEIEWTCLKGIDPFPATIQPWMPGKAKARFLETYNSLRMKMEAA